MWEQSEFGGGADVVEAADFGLGFVAPLCDSSIPVVMQMHGSQGQIALHDPLNSQWLDDTLALAFETSLALRAAAVQSPSISNAEYWASQMARIVACHRPAWAPEVSRSEQGRISQRISVFGRVQRWKGPHILCDALRIMGARAPSVDWYGRDTRFDSSGRMCSQWLAEEFPDVWGTRVVWHSQVPPAQVAEIQSRSLLNLVPSTWDVFNFVCVEAMASGRPLICSSGAGASELVENGVTGFVYENNSPEELAATIERALSLTKMQQSDIGEAARRTVTAALDPNRIATERISDYHAAIAEGSCRKLPEPQAWLQRLCIPGASEPESYAFLDQLPLSSIARYAAVRTLKKLRS
jgi:glycosyltransferase involved in cell wall biosynthesis